LVTGVIRHQDGKRAISVLTMRSLVSLGRKNENFGRQIDFARQTRPKSRRFYYQFRGSLDIIKNIWSSGQLSSIGKDTLTLRSKL
jgi:hypothetical protein